MQISLLDAVKKYGKIENNKWNDESKWMVVVHVPDDISKNWINSASNNPTIKVYINRDAAQPLLNALKNIKNNNLLHELKTFDGCFIIRDVRGIVGAVSCHSYGLAIDLNAKTNPLGGFSTFSPQFIKCFTDAGWSYGGTFKRKDPMHFSFGWE